MKLNLSKDKIILVAISGLIFGLIGFYLGKYMSRRDYISNMQQRRIQNGGNSQNGQRQGNGSFQRAEDSPQR